jgi:hypothetical protein
MSTTWGGTAPQDENQWQQPDFSTSTTPVVTGVVLRSGETSVPVSPGTEEQRLRTIRRLLFPIVLVGGLITGMWWQFIVVAVVTSMVLRRRIWQLAYQRVATADPMGNRWQSGPSDLR